MSDNWGADIFNSVKKIRGIMNDRDYSEIEEVKPNLFREMGIDECYNLEKELNF